MFASTKIHTNLHKVTDTKSIGTTPVLNLLQKLNAVEEAFKNQQQDKSLVWKRITDEEVVAFLMDVVF